MVVLYCPKSIEYSFKIFLTNSIFLLHISTRSDLISNHILFTVGDAMAENLTNELLRIYFLQSQQGKDLIYTPAHW